MNNINSDGFQYENKPIQLIKFDKQNFMLNKKAMDMLKSIKEEIIVISVVGKARTGKSFLMNTLLELNGSEEGVNILFNFKILHLISLKLNHQSTPVLKEFGYGEIIKERMVQLRK